MAKHSAVVLMLQNSVLLALGRYKKDRDSLKIALNILNQSHWYEELHVPAVQFQIWISKMIAKYQKMDEISLYRHFKYNSEQIKRDIESRFYLSYTHLLESIVDIKETNEESFIKYHYEIFPFVKVKGETPMLQLGYDLFFEYIEALIIYAASDNSDFNLHENETMLIMNEIRSYVQYRPVENAVASDMFFAVLEVAKAKSKNHISTRFEGIVKSNLKQMTDEQDAYFLKMLKNLQQSDGVHSTQEKMFDSIIELSVEKVAPYEAKEKEAQSRLTSILNRNNPFAAYRDVRAEFRRLIPSNTQEAIVHLWKSVEGIMLSFYDQYHILDINKKNLYYLFTLKEFELETFEYLVAIREFLPMAKFVNWDENDADKFISILSRIYRCFEVEDENVMGEPLNVNKK
jgi:hypothetical protein